MPTLMRESALVRQILDYCQYRNLLFWRNQSGMVRTQNKYGQQHMMRLGLLGSPDILGCYHGKFVGVECKVGNNKPTPAQTAFGKLLVANGGVYWVVYSVEEFMEQLKTL